MTSVRDATASATDNPAAAPGFRTPAPTRRTGDRVRARRAARHREQAAAAAQATLRLDGLRQEWAGAEELAGAVVPEMTDHQRAVAHDAFKARLRAARASGTVPATSASLARFRAAEARQDPHSDQPADTDPGHDGAAPWNPKNSVAAQDREAASDLREHPEKTDHQKRSGPPDLGSRYDQRNNPLQHRMRFLDQARRITGLPSLKRCGAVPIAGAVSITQKADGKGGFSGLFRCGSVWSCPECSPVVRAERARVMEAYALAWMSEEWTAADGTEHTGHGMAMATLTSRHGKHAQLSDGVKRDKDGALVLDADGKPKKVEGQLSRTAGAWRRMLQSRWWKGERGFCARYGITGATRAVELTHSFGNGWHSHIHAILWTEQEIDTDTAATMQEELFDRWAAECAHAKLGKPTRKHGVKVDPARRGKDGAADLAKYVVKLDHGGALGNELLRGDLKVGRAHGRTPFEILALALAGSDADLALWREYERATKGHLMLTWTGSIRQRLADLAGELERDALTIVTDDDTAGTTAVLVQVAPGAWRSKVVSVDGRRGQLRVAVEVASAAAIKAGLDMETGARATVREVLESWGLVWGIDLLGPGESVDPSTGELYEGQRIVPPPRYEHHAAHWQTTHDLEAAAGVTGTRPRDWVRPEQARRRAAGLPIARDIR